MYVILWWNHMCINMCMCILVFTSTYTSMRVCAYVCSHIYGYIYTFIYTCIHTYLQTYIHTYIHTYTHAYMQKNATSTRPTTLRNWNPSVQIEIQPRSQYEFVPQDTKESGCLDLVDFGDVTFFSGNCHGTSIMYKYFREHVQEGVMSHEWVPTKHKETQRDLLEHTKEAKEHEIC